MYVVKLILKKEAKGLKRSGKSNEKKFEVNPILPSLAITEQSKSPVTTASKQFSCYISLSKFALTVSTSSFLSSRLLRMMRKPTMFSSFSYWVLQCD